MNCRYARKHFAELFDVGAEDRAGSDLAAHVTSCPRCRPAYEEAQAVLAAIRPSHSFGASPDFKDRVMARITNMTAPALGRAVRRRPVRRRRRLVLAVGMVALLAVVVWIANEFDWRLATPTGEGPRSRFALLSQISAAEEAFFLAEEGKMVHLVNEILVKAVSNAGLASLRWWPICSLDATGRIRFHQLSLPAETGEAYTVTDETSYDPATGRFARVVVVEGGVIFANAYDGVAVYSLESTEDGALSVKREPVAQDFRPPRNPADFLGITAGLRSRIDEKDEALVQAAGDAELADGSPVRVLKAGFPGPEGTVEAYCLFRIRKDDGTIAETEFVAGGESQLVVRRAGAETVEQPAVPWDLAGVDAGEGEAGLARKARVRSDMVVPDVGVRHMVEKAGFETYVFASSPPWAGDRQITDVLDLVSPPHRMFMISHRAGDGRHVVLVQSHSYNRMLGPVVSQGRLVYTSPTGFKVWGGPRCKWLAGILLTSARASIGVAAAEGRTGYILQSPAGTFPCLAINGPLSVEELHALVDSLVPARDYAGE